MPRATEENLLRELQVLLTLKNLEPFTGNEFRKTRSSTDHFDFESTDGSIKIEVKTRSRELNRYPDDFLIAGKIEEMNQNLDNVDYYAAFYYVPSGIVRLFHLNKIDLGQPEDLEFTHWSTRERQTRKIYRVKNQDNLLEVEILPESAL